MEYTVVFCPILFYFNGCTVGCHSPSTDRSSSKFFSSCRRIVTSCFASPMATLIEAEIILWLRFSCQCHARPFPGQKNEDKRAWCHAFVFVQLGNNVGCLGCFSNTIHESIANDTICARPYRHPSHDGPRWSVLKRIVGRSATLGRAIVDLVYLPTRTCSVFMGGRGLLSHGEKLTLKENQYSLA